MPDADLIPISAQDFFSATWPVLESALAAYVLMSVGDGMQLFESGGRVAIARYHRSYFTVGGEFRRYFLRVKGHPQTFLCVQSGPDRNWELQVGGVLGGEPSGEFMPAYNHNPGEHLAFCFNHSGHPVLFK
jgi:hypothetical protein